MKNIVKKHISLLLAAAIIIATVSACILTFGYDNVEINEENFPDANFRAAVSLMYDADRDGYLSARERDIQSMIVSGIIEMLAFETDVDENDLPVNNLKGIEFFENLKTIRCSSVGTISTLDLSSLDKLETLVCNDLGLESLILPVNGSLVSVDACSNEFEELDFSDNANLRRIYCYSNDNLREINVRSLDKLEQLSCYDCEIESLDLSTNTSLNYLNCSYNHLTKLDLSACTALADITEYDIGYQDSSATVSAENGVIVIPFSLEQDRVASSSLDTDGASAFSDGAFYTNDISLENGIDYYYKTGVSDSALMSVHLSLTESEHGYLLRSFNCADGEGDIQCIICKDSYKLSFADSINAVQGDSDYSEHLDVVRDGIINAKDYAVLMREYK